MNRLNILLNKLNNIHPNIIFITPKYIRPGRWDINYNKITRKIDMANYDNCYMCISKNIIKK
jgi:hypothetical protein